MKNNSESTIHLIYTSPFVKEALLFQLAWQKEKEKEMEKEKEKEMEKEMEKEKVAKIAKLEALLEDYNRKIDTVTVLIQLIQCTLWPLSSTVCTVCYRYMANKLNNEKLSANKN